MKTKVRTFLLSIFAGLIICGSSFASGKISNEHATKIVKNTDPILQDQGKYGKDSALCITNISLYREFFKQWKASKYKSPGIEDAIGPWCWVFDNCPKASQNIYIDGLKMFEFYMKKAKSDEDKDNYIDTMMMIYDKRIKYFGREGYVLGRKGSDLFKYKPEEYEKAYYIFKKSVELRGNKSESFVLIYYFRTTSKMVDAGKIEKGVIVDTYDQVSEIINHNLEANKDDSKKLSNWENVNGSIELAFEPYATCEDLIDIYKKKFEETPEDIKLLKKITKILDKKNCTKSDLFFQASVKLNELDPSPASSYLIAKMLVKNEKFNESIRYLEEASKVEDDDSKADVYLLMASVYSKLKDLQKARTFARKSIDLRPDNGHPYLIIGDLYAGSAKNCGNNDLTSKVAYWAAVDKYKMAKKMGPDVAELANKRIALYSKHFPHAETIFFYDLKVGDPYTVECWINEKTTVRAAK